MTPQPIPETLLLSPEHLAELQASGLTEAQAAATGHATVTAEQAKALVGHPLPGMLFCYRDESGIPYQIEVGKWGRKPYYRLKPDWSQVDSTTKDGYLHNGSLPKYLSAPSSGSRPYLSSLLPFWERVFSKPSIDLTITEGEKKGDALCAHKVPCLAFAGVSSFVDRSASHGDWMSGSGSQWDTQDPAHHAGRFLPELERINWRGRSVAVCFDSDLIFNRAIQRQTEKLISFTRARGSAGYPVLLPFELDGSKNGLDDFLARHGFEAWTTLNEAFRQMNEGKFKMIEYKKPTKENGDLAGGTLVPYGDGIREDETDSQYAKRMRERCFFKLTEPPKHIKALMAWAILKERWAYRPGLGWYQWKDTHWEICPDPVLLEADLTRFMDRQGWIDRSLDLMAHVIKDMRSRVIIPESRWSPQHLVNFTNGTLDTTTNQIHKHRPEDYQISVLPFDYDPQAQCPQWLQFLEQATGGDKPLQSVLRAWMRWILAPKDRTKKFPIEKSLAIIGRKGGGKGTFLGVLRALVGEQNIGSAAPEVFGTAEGLGQLVDKTLALDPDATGFMGGVGNYNKIVSNEPLLVKKLYKDPTTVCLGVVVVQAFNRFLDMPATGSEGADRRMCVIPFDFQPTHPDTNLSEKLNTELPGIFSWAWTMGLQTAIATIAWSGNIKQVQRASVERFEFNNPVYRFLSESYPDGHMDGMKASYVFSDYQEWAKANGHRCMSQTTFGTELNRLGIAERNRLSDGRYYLIPPMASFDIAGYLRIRTDSPPPMPLFSDECDSSLEGGNPSNPDSLVGEVASDENNPTLSERALDVMQGYAGNAGGSETPGKNTFFSEAGTDEMTHEPPQKPRWVPTGEAIAPGDMVDINGSAKLHRKGSFAIKDQHLLAQDRAPDAVIPLVALPDWIQEEFDFKNGPWRVHSLSSDGQRAKLRLNGGKVAVIGIEGLYAVREA
jgi:putative DNA primase/helicase